MSSRRREPGSGARAQARVEALICPVCDARCEVIHCKVTCPRCHTVVMNCSEF